MKKNRVILCIIGETGSGKSTLAQQLKQQLGGQIIEGDKIGHLVLLRQEIIDTLVSRYTKDILEEDSVSINRKKLGNIVFNDSQELLLLNELTHPIIRESIIDLLKKYEDEPYVFIDGAALIEAKILPLCDIVVYLKVPSHIRLQRLIEGRKIDELKAKAMIKSQMKPQYYESQASLTLYSDDTINLPFDSLLDYIHEYKEHHTM